MLSGIFASGGGCCRLLVVGFGVAEVSESVFDGGVCGGVDGAGDVYGFHSWCEVLGVFFHDGCAGCGVECFDVGLELSAVVVLSPGVGEDLS